MLITRHSLIPITYITHPSPLVTISLFSIAKSLGFGFCFSLSLFPSCTVGGYANWCSHYGKQYGGSSKFENRTILQSSNCTTRYLPKEYKNTNSKGYMHPNENKSIIYKNQIMETALKCPLANEWIKKM